MKNKVHDLRSQATALKSTGKKNPSHVNTAAIIAFAKAPFSFIAGTNDQAAILCAKTNASRKLPITIKIIPLIISEDGGFLLMSIPSSRPQAFPNKGVYQMNPKTKLATTAIIIAS